MELGMPGRIRTPDLLIRSQTLYPAELRAQTHSKLLLKPYQAVPVVLSKVPHVM